jgi:CheY-like chemotaxis protein
MSCEQTDCKNILIIEDDKSIREMMQDVLELEGYKIHVAANGQEAVDALNGFSSGKKLPCVVLLDLMMPVLNGWQFLDFQRNHPTLKKIPVVVVSAYAESARSVRPQAVVTKPIQLGSLLSAVQSLCA